MERTANHWRTTNPWRQVPNPEWGWRICGCCGQAWLAACLLPAYVRGWYLRQGVVRVRLYWWRGLV
jgi:hypothetical protein